MFVHVSEALICPTLDTVTPVMVLAFHDLLHISKLVTNPRVLLMYLYMYGLYAWYNTNQTISPVCQVKTKVNEFYRFTT